MSLLVVRKLHFRFQHLSLSKSEYSYDHCKDDVKKALLGAMAVNNLAESLFAGVTVMLQLG